MEFPGISFRQLGTLPLSAARARCRAAATFVPTWPVVVRAQQDERIRRIGAIWYEADN